MAKTNAQTAVVSKTAKATTPVNKDAIVQSSAGPDKALHIISSVGGQHFSFPSQQWTGEIRKLCAIGASFSAAKAAIKALPTVKVDTQLARGLGVSDAPHSNKSLADSKRGQPKASNKADAATQKVPATKKVAAPKADEKAAKLVASDARKITFVAANPKRPGTASFDRFASYKKGMTVAQALAAGVTRADIDWDSKRDFIKFA